MRICIFSHTFPRFPGDTAAPFMGTFAEALAKRGHMVFVLVPFDAKFDKKIKRPYKLVAYKYIYPDSFHKLGYSRTLKDDKKMSPSSYILSPLLYLFSFFALLKLVKEKKIDIISSHWIIPNGFVAAIISKVCGIPFTTTIPGSDIYMGTKNPLFRWMVGFAAKSADFVLSDSDYYIKQLNNLGFFPKKTQVIRYGVDTTKFHPIQKDEKILKRLSLVGRFPILLAVGRMVAKKGFSYLIDAMPTIVKSVPSVKLVMVGDGDQRSSLEEKVRNLGINNNVIFAGTILHNELSKYYNIADIFVMPSIKDKSGNIDAAPVAMLEAMACGCMAVATRFAGSDDLIRQGETGYLVKEKDSSQIASSIIELLKKRTGRKAKMYVKSIAKKKFSSEVVALKYEKIFNEII